MQPQRFDQISLTKMRDLFGDDFADQTLQKAQKYIDAQKLLLRDSTLFLMPDGKFFADGIAADLFFWN